MRRWGALLLVLAIGVLAWGMRTQRVARGRPDPLVQSPAPAGTIAGRLQLRTFATSRGWGYAVYAGNRLLIHQPFIPGLTGNRGFRTEQKAHTAGQWVVGKLRRGLGPPSVSRRELDSLGVLDSDRRRPEKNGFTP